jgi:hypothetical protein
VPELALKIYLPLNLSDEHGLADPVDSACSIELAASPSIENLGLALSDCKAVPSWLQASSSRIKSRRATSGNGPARVAARRVR